MKIAVIADVLGEENNGTSITVKRLIDNLKARGHEVFVVSPKSSVPRGEGYYEVEKIDFKILNGYVAKNGVELAKPNLELLEKVIRPVDVVHALMPFPLGRAAVRMCKEMGKPCTTAFHVQPENVSSHIGLQKSKPVNNYIYKNFLKGFYSYTEYIHCPTQFIATKLREHGYTQDLRVISNGVDPVFVPKKTEKPAAFKDDILLLSTGRLAKEKCHVELLRGALRSKYADKIRVLIAGEGPERKKLERLGKKFKKRPVICFRTKEELVNVINYCDLYVHPSYAEIESIACVEAITCGLVPVIADSKMSAARFFAQHASNLYRAGSPADLAKKIDYLIEHPEERERQREEYIRYAERFAIDACIDKMIEMFEGAIRGVHR